jgi:TetR/AcrR family transcriptional regulator, cholesterol catabolism regulator
MSSKIGIKNEVAALKRERTLGAAVDLFYERGYENSTLEAVAERLGVTKPFIYSHFGSKADLLAEICGSGISKSLEAIDSVQGTKGPVAERLRMFAQRFVTVVLENQKHIAIFTREEKNLETKDFKRISDMRRDFDGKLVSLLESGVKTGELHIGDPQIAALAIGGMVSWAYVWYRPKGRLSVSEVADEMSDLIQTMVGSTAQQSTAPQSNEPGPKLKRPRVRAL